MANRVHNFNPGPSVLPLKVLERLQAEFLDYKGSGMSVLEISHRAADYKEINETVEKLLRELMGIPANYKVLFLGGGASLQFVMVPMNLLKPGQAADFLNTGTWTKKALKEAQILGKTRLAATTEKDGVFTRVPRKEEIQFDHAACYVHMCTNNTIFGSQWHWIPETGKVPLVVDMSSDFMSRKLDVSRFGLVFGGAQKNLGPAGATVVILRDDVLASCRQDIPIYMRYETHVKEQSLYNTPPVFAVFTMKLTLEWVKEQGGVATIEGWNRKKAERIYGVIDTYPDFYRAPVEKESRSLMNAVFRLPSPELETAILDAAKKEKFVGLKGHRSVGGMRVSMYNFCPVESIEVLAKFLEDFAKKHA